MSVKATYLGHSAVLIEGEKTKVIVDPFLTGNPKASARAEDLEADLALLTHDHEDHFGDIVSFLKRGATFVGIHEHAVRFQDSGYKAEGMNIGGWIETQGVRVHMTHALHTCYTGHCVGFVVEIDGKQIYHAGDTGLTLDMKLIGEFCSIDLAFLPIGDRYTMGAKAAARAAEWIGAKKVVPIHYGTWPPIAGDPEGFASMVGAAATILAPGESIRL